MGRTCGEPNYIELTAGRGCLYRGFAGHHMCGYQHKSQQGFVDHQNSECFLDAREMYAVVYNTPLPMKPLPRHYR